MRAKVEILQHLNKELDKKWHIPPNISANPGLIFTKISALVEVDMCMEIIMLTKVLRYPKGRCYGNELSLKAFCRCRN